LKFFDRLFDIFILPEELALLRDRVTKLEQKALEYHAREPRVYVVADEKPKMELR